jgi:DNA-binding IclR family transcriptional regulator
VAGALSSEPEHIPDVQFRSYREHGDWIVNFGATVPSASPLVNRAGRRWCRVARIDVFAMGTTRPHPAQAERLPTVQSVDRAVALLKAIAGGGEPATAAELALACGINRSTAWRLLSTLEANGLVERDTRNQRYAIGYAAFQVASAAEDDAIARRVRPILMRMAEETGEIVTLAAARRFSLVYVDQVDPPKTLSPSWMGRPIPLHATSSGKVFLAWLPEQERDSLLHGELETFTEKTITDRAALETELAEIRRVGYGACVGEFEDFSNGVSAAVLDRRGRPLVIVNIWGPSQRVTRARLPGLGRAALRTAHEITAGLE